jgi:regulator of CtrA degradation
MSQQQAAAEKHRVKLSPQDLASSTETFARLPAQLQELCRYSLRLQARVLHLDELLYRAKTGGEVTPRAVHVHTQIEQLRAAFPNKF